MKTKILSVAVVMVGLVASFGFANDAQAADPITTERMEVCTYDKHVDCLMKDSVIVNIPVSGTYTISGNVGRGTNSICQEKEEFELLLNNSKHIATSRDPESCEQGTVFRNENYGQIHLEKGNNTLNMKHLYPTPQSTYNAQSVSVVLTLTLVQPDIKRVSVEVDKNDNDNRDDKQEVQKGKNATFRIIVKNTGEVALKNVRVRDAQAPLCNRDFSGVLNPGEQRIYTCSDINVENSYTNVAEVTATGFNGVGNVLVKHNDKSYVTVRKTASVRIDKNDNDNRDDKQVVQKGGKATFRIKVTNTGQAVLKNISVTDSEAPGCNRRYPASAKLNPGESIQYTCSDANVNASYINVAQVSAVGEIIEGVENQTVTHSDRSSVTVQSKVSVEINKNDNDNGDDTQTINSGEEAKFKITVKNLGQVELKNIQVKDALAPACDYTYSGTLAPQKSFEYTCSDPGVVNSYTNLAEVTATGNDGVSNVVVTDGDISNVVVTEDPEDPEDPEDHEDPEDPEDHEDPEDPEEPKGKCKGSIGNYIWNDENMDGVQDSNEKGLENIRIKAVWDGGDGKFGNSNDETYRTDTNHNGHYEFSGLCEGEYKVTVKEEDTKGLKQTYDPDGKLDNKTKVTLDSDKDKTTKIDFGYVGKTIPVTGPGEIAIVLAAVAAIGTLILIKRKKSLVA